MLSAGGNPQGMIEFLTDIYDREHFEVKTKNMGTDTILGPYITLLACMTREQANSLFRAALITGGFSRRMVFVYSRSRNEPIARPRINPLQEEARSLCLSHLQKVTKASGEYKFTNESGEWFDAWYAAKFKEIGLPHTPAFKNWLMSKDTMLIKMAMCLDLAGDPTYRLTIPNLERGLSMLNAIEDGLDRIFSGAGKNPLADLAMRALSRLEEAPDQTMQERQILSALFSEGKKEDVLLALEHLITSEVIVRVTLTTDQGRQPGYRVKVARPQM